MVSDKGYPRIDGRNTGTAEIRGIPENNTESCVCTLSGICTSPGWIEVRVCDGGVTLRREI